MLLEDAPPRRPRGAPPVPPRLLVVIGVAALAVALVLAIGSLVSRPHGPAGPPARPPGLADLWAGRAALVLDRKWTSAALGQPGGGVYAGAHVEVVGNAWYLFNRSTMSEQCPGRGPKLGIQVRKSDDRGHTWSAPASIIAPTSGTPWACAATDGDAVFDSAAGTWRYLFQCMGEQGGWNGCYAERHDRDPRGPFAPPAGVANPVIPAGSLWSRICDDPGDRCARAAGQAPISDEGTFNIFAKDRNGWWVGFHGSDGPHGFRGIGFTHSFRAGDWEVDGAGGTPTDAVIDASDATGWRETWKDGGPVGAGAASIVEQGGWYYQLAEVPDTSLSCRADQSWDLGLFRTRRLSSSRWEQLPAGNPLVYSSRAVETDGQSIACNVEYPGLFADPETGTTYLMHGRLSHDARFDGIYVYRLEWDRNRLANGDFRRGETLGWDALPGTTTQLAVERKPDESPDGTPDLAFNCGAATCDGNEGVYQDAKVRPGDAGQTFAFGGSIRSETGTGAVDLALYQIDGAGRVVTMATLPVDATQTYARVRRSVEIDERATSLRLQLAPHSPGSFRADNLYVIPQSGCSGPGYPRC